VYPAAASDRVLLHQQAVPLQIELCVLEERLITGELSLGLLELDLKSSRIDLGQQISGPDDLTLSEQHLHELAVDPALHGYAVQWRHRTEADQIHPYVAGSGGCRDDRCAADLAGALRILPRLGRAGRRVCTLRDIAVGRGGHQTYGQCAGPPTPMASYKTCARLHAAPQVYVATKSYRSS
jgi:hypothetical protein